MIPTSQIAAVTAPKVHSNAVGREKMRDAAIGRVELGSSAVTTSKLAAGAVTGSKVADNSITSAEIADGTLAPDDLHYLARRPGALALVEFNGQIDINFFQGLNDDMITQAEQDATPVQGKWCFHDLPLIPHAISVTSSSGNIVTAELGYEQDSQCPPATAAVVQSRAPSTGSTVPADGSFFINLWE